jgi:hypothetical protein
MPSGRRPSQVRGITTRDGTSARRVSEWIEPPRRWFVNDALWDAEWLAGELCDLLQDELAESRLASGELRQGTFEVPPAERPWCTFDAGCVRVTRGLVEAIGEPLYDMSTAAPGSVGDAPICCGQTFPRERRQVGCLAEAFPRERLGARRVCGTLRVAAPTAVLTSGPAKGPLSVARTLAAGPCGSVEPPG